MKKTKTFFLFAVLLALAAPAAFAQHPKQVHIIVPFPAGGGTDILARMVAERLRGSYAPVVIVENKVGASGRLGVETVKAAEADGSTLLFTPDFLMTVYPHSFRKLGYDPVADFAPVAIVARSQLTLVAGAGVPGSVGNARDYIAWVKSDLKKRGFFATTSAGGTPHFVGVMLAHAAGLDLSPVHYKGGAPALQDLLAGQIPVSINPVGEALPYIKSGKIRALATTGAQRSRFLPEVPTLSELGFKDVVVQAWLGIFAPARTPRATVERLAAALGEIARSPAFAANLDKFGMEPYTSSPAEFAATVKSDIRRWAPIVKASGFTAED